MVIALEGKPISAYAFRLFLLSLGLTCGQDITSKAIFKLVNLPRESSLEYSNAFLLIYFSPVVKHLLKH